jgi:hypothetical protein
MASCMVCGSRDGLQRFALTVDGVPLRLQPDLCQTHGDVYLLLAGRAFGELLLTKNEESGRPISEPAPAPPSIPAAAAAAPSPAQPDITISGRPEEGACPCGEGKNPLHALLRCGPAVEGPFPEVLPAIVPLICGRCGRRGHRASEPPEPAGRACRVALGQERAACLSCDGTGTFYGYVNAAKGNEKRHLTCRACGGTGRA